MNDRRLFIKSSLIIGAGAASLSEGHANESNIGAVPGYKYKVPNFSKGDLILFIGDSITDMNWGVMGKPLSGSQLCLFNCLKTRVEIPHAKLEFFNRGHSGNELKTLRNDGEGRD